jgi:hypothetical protein
MVQNMFHRDTGGKVSVFECYYSGTILLGLIGVLANLQDSLEK